MSVRILVVDDEPSIRKVLAAQLGRHGFEVVAAEHGDAAIAVLLSEEVDVVLTDLRMPQRDGLSLVQWLAAERPGLPAIVITAHGTIESAVDALKAGAFDYVTKPFDQDELHATLLAALAHARPTGAAPAPDEDLDLKAFVRRHTTRVERHRIQQALDEESGNVTHAARRLGVSRRSLQTKMRDYGLRDH